MGAQVLNFLRFEGGGLGLDLLVLREEGARDGPLGVSGRAGVLQSWVWTRDLSCDTPSPALPAQKGDGSQGQSLSKCCQTAGGSGPC